MDISLRLPDAFNGAILIAIALILSFLGLNAVGVSALSSKSSESPIRRDLLLAYFIALGIGLHNMGEGLSIGAAYAIGEVALGAFLILGFTIHNVTEGIAIIAPLKRGIAIRHIAYLGLLAGAPTIFGTLIGGFTLSDLWALIFLSIGAGAIFQVVYEVFLFLSERGNFILELSNRRNLLGLFLGFAAMYTTGLLIPS
ncbi:MAG: hypothetical protein QXX95_05510 [Nitrososphaerales archaeon]